MSESGRVPARIGVRELRQNLSVYLRRIEQGETIEVTDRGRPVARLTPLDNPETSVLERMIAEGRARPAARPFSGFRPMMVMPEGVELSRVLREQRDEESN